MITYPPTEMLNYSTSEIIKEIEIGSRMGYKKEYRPRWPWPWAREKFFEKLDALNRNASIPINLLRNYTAEGWNS
jgi:hypothetical protein